MQNAKDEFYIESTLDMFNEGYLEDADERVMRHFTLFLTAGFTHQQIADMLTPAHVMVHFKRLTDIDKVKLAERMTPEELYEYFDLLSSDLIYTSKLAEIAEQWTYRQVARKIDVLREKAFSLEFFDVALFRLDDEEWHDLINLADYDDNLMQNLLELASRDLRMVRDFVTALAMFYDQDEIMSYLKRLASLNVAKSAISSTLVDSENWSEFYEVLIDDDFPVPYENIVKYVENEWGFSAKSDTQLAALRAIIAYDNKFIMKITPEFIRSFCRVYDWNYSLYEEGIESMINQYRIHFLETVMLAYGHDVSDSIDAVEFGRALMLLEEIVGPEDVNLYGYDIGKIYTSLTNEDRINFADVADTLAKYALR